LGGFVLVHLVVVTIHRGLLVRRDWRCGLNAIWWRRFLCHPGALGGGMLGYPKNRPAKATVVASGPTVGVGSRTLDNAGLAQWFHAVRHFFHRRSLPASSSSA
jgi:hypothetical protein